MEILQGPLGAKPLGPGRVGQATCPIPTAGTAPAAASGQAAGRGCIRASGAAKASRGVAARGKKSTLAGSQEAFARGEQTGLLGKLELRPSRDAGRRAEGNGAASSEGEQRLHPSQGRPGRGQGRGCAHVLGDFCPCHETGMILTQLCKVLKGQARWAMFHH